jgi:hypothetical protein
MRILALYAIISVLSLIGGPAMAGQLFPPANAPSIIVNGQNVLGPCLDGKVLGWTDENADNLGKGSQVSCVDPTNGIDLKKLCPPGQALTGITKGVPKCEDSVPDGTLCGSAFWETHDADPAATTTFWSGNFQVFASCQGHQIYKDCPAGYRETQLAYSWFTSVDPAQCGSYPSCNVRYHQETCVRSRS